MPSVAHDIPEFIVHKIMLQSYALNPHPTAKIIKDYIIYAEFMARVRVIEL